MVDSSGGQRAADSVDQKAAEGWAVDVRVGLFIAFLTPTEISSKGCALLAKEEQLKRRINKRGACFLSAPHTGAEDERTQRELKTLKVMLKIRM